MNFDKMFQHKQISNVAQLLNRRSLGLDKSAKDPLHVYGESCAASFCSSNHKVDLPPRSRSTFMTAFSPNHELMASCHGDHNVHVTNLQSRKVVKSLIGHERTPWCISFHPSCNDILATGCLNGEVRVWDLRGGGSESWTTDPTDQSTITSLSFHPTDHVLLIASGNEIHFWDWNVPKPFVSIKTNSIVERVQLVRFDAFGTRILTGIVNCDDDRAHHDEVDDDADNFLVNPSGAQQRHQMNRTGSMVNSWFSNVAPVLSITTRSPTSRPLTASYNLRGRHDARALSSSDNSSTAPNLREDPHSAHPPTDARSRLFDNVVSSRDHQRILHARVNVQAEIRHQYHRLQQLRQERRRLEVRLRQLQQNNEIERPDGGASESRRGLVSGEGPSLRSAVQSREIDAFHDYREITQVLATRVQENLTSSLNSPAIEVSVDWHAPSSSTPPAPEPSDSSVFVPDTSGLSAPPTASIFTALASSSSSLFSPIPPGDRVLALPSDPPPDNEAINSSYFRRRVRRAESSRRLHARRRSYFSHMWPLPDDRSNSIEKTSYRLQWWDFSRLEVPEISSCDVCVAVRQCKIHNDSSVDLSSDGRKVAALIWSDSSPHLVQVGVFSLDEASLGQLLYKKSFGPSQYAVCLSLSPLGNYLAVGLKYYSYLSEGLQGRRGTMAEILKLGRLGDPESHFPVQRIIHPDQTGNPHGRTSVNTIAWLPQVGQGLVYGTNNGDLRLCFTSPQSAPDPTLPPG